MSEKKPNPLMSMPPAVVGGAIEHGLKLLQSEEVSAPLSWKNHLANLELILTELAKGDLVIATPPDSDGAAGNGAEGDGA